MTAVFKLMAAHMVILPVTLNIIQLNHCNEKMHLKSEKIAECDQTIIKNRLKQIMLDLLAVYNIVVVNL